MHNQPDSGAVNSTIFITGATGFIGQNLAVGLLARGHRVRVMIRPGLQFDKRVPRGCEEIPVDLADVGKLTAIVAGSDAVIYCAGSVRGRSAADFAAANIDGVAAMARSLDESGHPPPLLLLSSLAASRPQLSDYAHSKFMGEQVLTGKKELPWTILRPPAVYGPGDKEMLPLLKWIRRGYALHPGPREQRLSLLHVDDLVRAIEAWLAAPQSCVHKVFAIDDGTPGGYDWEDIAHAVSQRRARMIPIPRFLLDFSAGMNLFMSSLFRYSPMLTPGKVRELVHPEWLCDNQAFTAATGWQPSLDLNHGSQSLFSV